MARREGRGHADAGGETGGDISGAIEPVKLPCNQTKKVFKKF